jgi:hypothetical protein
VSNYLLSTYEVEKEVHGAPQTPEEMQAFTERVVALEDEMEATGTFVFGGALHGPDASTFLREGVGGIVMTDGPFVEAKEHIAGFYVLRPIDSASTLDARALSRTRYARSGAGYFRDTRRLSRDSTSRSIRD